MLQGAPSRRGTIKSLKSFIGIPEDDEIVFEPTLSKSDLDILYLPPTIPNLKYMSPSLWNSITNGSYCQVFSPAGELLTEALPRALTQPPPLPTTERPILSKAKQARKPVQETVQENKYFFINIKHLGLNKIQGPVICLVGMEDQKRCSSVVEIIKSKSSVGYGELNEGFLFEIPKQKQQVVLSIRVYSKHGTLVASPSNVSLSNSSKLGGLFKKRTQTASSSFTFTDLQGPRVPADPSALGMLLCDYTMTLPSAHPFGKLDMGYALNSGKKEMGKVHVSMSMMFEAPYSPVGEVPRGMHSNDDYLNFYLHTNGGLIWDKKWVVGTSTGLRIYSAIFGQERAEIGWIPYTQMMEIKKAPREFMAAPHCFQVSIVVPWKDDLSQFNPTTLSRTWKDQVAEAGLGKNGSMDIYVTADSSHQFQKWKDFLECHIARYHSRR